MIAPSAAQRADLLDLALRLARETGRPHLVVFVPPPKCCTGQQDRIPYVVDSAHASAAERAAGEEVRP